MQRHDHRLSAFFDPVDDDGEGRLLSWFAEFTDISTPAKSPAAAREDDCLDIVVGFCLVHGRNDRFPDRNSQGVNGRIVQRNERDFSV